MNLSGYLRLCWLSVIGFGVQLPDVPVAKIIFSGPTTLWLPWEPLPTDSVKPPFQISASNRDVPVTAASQQAASILSSWHYQNKFGSAANVLPPRCERQAIVTTGWSDSDHFEIQANTGTYAHPQKCICIFMPEKMQADSCRYMHKCTPLQSAYVSSMCIWLTLVKVVFVLQRQNVFLRIISHTVLGVGTRVQQQNAPKSKICTKIC